MLKKNQDSYKRSMDICAHAGFEPKVIMYFDQLQTAYNVARSGQFRYHHFLGMHC